MLTGVIVTSVVVLIFVEWSAHWSSDHNRRDRAERHL